MPSAVSVPVPAFTLTFGGVDFRLDPSNANDASQQVSFQSNDDGVIVNLQSFTGTLRVSLPAAADTAATSATSNTATVEEYPASPATATPASNARRPGVSPTQKQLPFAKANKPAAAKKATSVTKTPDFGSSDASMPTKPKKTAPNKRALLEIQTNPVLSPLKKTKGSSEESLPLGQLSQPEEPTQSSQVDGTQVENTQADTIIDCSQTQTDQSIMMDTDPNSENSILQMDESSKLSIDVGDERKGHAPPSARWGMTCTMVAGNRVLVYGGQTIHFETKLPTILSDIYVYDVSKRLWYKPVNCEGVPRQWHTATYLPERQLLISFGGETIHPKTKRLITTDQVMVLDTEIMLWYPPTVTGVIPSGRSGHTATILPDTNELVVFGGVRGSKFQNSLAVLDISRWKWSAPKISGEPPRPRSYHSATPMQGTNGKSQLVIFGGNGASSSFNSVHVLETDGKTWQWINPKVSGTAPLPRTGHCATLLADKKTILIYGGWDPNSDDVGDDPVYGDSFFLDTETWKWSAGPEPTFAGDGSSIAHSLAKDGGARRAGHDGVLVEGEGGTEVLVFGGRIHDLTMAGDFQSLKV